MFLAPWRRVPVAVLSVTLIVATLVPLLGSSFGVQVAGAANPTGTCPTAPTQLTNASFEDPAFNSNSYHIVPQSQVPGWSTTASTGNIEIWTQTYNGVNAFDGRQFAELNADAAGALYQDLPTTPGQTLVWSLHHRARQGTDTMYVDIGVPGQTLARQATLTDNISAGWDAHTGTYVVPAGQTITRFAFVSGPTGSGSATVGNFLDDISFGTPSCVTAAKSVSPTGPVSVGTTLTYTIRLTNEGGSPTKNLVVNDPIPANTTYVAGSGGSNASYSNGTVSIQPAGSAGTPGVIEPGYTATATFQVVVGPGAAGQTISNTASYVETDGLGNTSTNSTNTTSNPVSQGSDVGITKSFSQTDIGGTYAATTDMTLHVFNNGPAAATNVNVTDALPNFGTDLTYPASATVSGGTTCSISGGGTLTCTISSLASGASTDIVLNGITSSSPAIADVVIANTAVASLPSGQYDPNPTNNSSTAMLVIHPTTTAIALWKTAQGPTQPPTITAGESVSFVFTIFNSGTTSLSGYTLVDSYNTGFTPSFSNLPSGVSCSYTALPRNITCVADSSVVLAPGASQQITVTETTDPGLTPSDCGGSGSVNTPWNCSDSAQVSSGSASSLIEHALVTVQNDPELLLTKTNTTAAVAGQQLSYQVTLVNLGPSTANNVVVTDNLPSNLPASSLLTVELPSQCTLSGYTITCALSQPLQPNVPLELNYNLILPNAAATYVNTASATCDNIEHPELATQTNTVTVDPIPDLVVTKSVAPQVAPVGGQVTYTLRVTNEGPGTANGVVVYDNADEVGVSVLSTSAPAGSYNFATSTWTVGTLLSGQTAILSVKAKVLRTGLIANTIIATASDPSETPPSKTATAYLNNPLFAVTGLEFAPMIGSALLLIAVGGAALVVVVLLRRRNA